MKNIIKLLINLIPSDWLDSLFDETYEAMHQKGMITVEFWYWDEEDKN